MKQFYFLIFFFSFYLSVNAQAYFNYNRQWATFYKQSLTHNAVNKDGKIFIVNSTYTGNLYPEEYLAPGDSIGRWVIGQLNTSGTYDYVKRIGGQNGTFFSVIDVTKDANGDFYIGGYTDNPNDVSTVGAYQESFANNMSLPQTITMSNGGSYTMPPALCADGFMMKYDAQGNKIWGTYFNGDQETKGMYLSSFNGYVYSIGATSSNSGLATPGTLLSTYPDTIYKMNPKAYIAKFNATTSALEWATYLPFDPPGVFERVKVDSENNVYVKGSGSPAVVYKIASDGSQILDTIQVPELDYLLKVEIDDLDNFYFYGRTSQATGVATPNTYRTTITASSEFCLLKYDANLTKLWGTYLYSAESLASSGISGNDFCFDKAKNAIYAGYLTNIDNQGTTGVYQTTIAGNLDSFFLKLDQSGQLLWYSYYGGADLETGINLLDVDDDENIYLGGYSKSATGISSAGAMYEYDDIPVSYGVIKAFVVKFSNTYLGLDEEEKYQTMLYPNPANDVVHLMSTYMLSPQVAISFYNTSGALVLKTKGVGANTQSISVASLAAGTYIVEVEDVVTGFSKTLKMVKR